MGTGGPNGQPGADASLRHRSLTYLLISDFKTFAPLVGALTDFFKLNLLHNVFSFIWLKSPIIHTPAEGKSRRIESTPLVMYPFHSLSFSTDCPGGGGGNIHQQLR